MMKKFFVMMGILCAIGAMAAETVVFAPALKQQKEGWFWCLGSIKASCKVSDGKAIYSITEKKAAKYGINDFQAAIPGYFIELKAGKKYTLSFTLKANKDFAVNTNAMLFGKPYTGFGGKYIKLKANQVQKISFEISTKKDFRGNTRMPGFNFGTAPAGTVLEISNIKLIAH